MCLSLQLLVNAMKPLTTKSISSLQLSTLTSQISIRWMPMRMIIHEVNVNGADVVVRSLVVWMRNNRLF